MRRTPLAFVVTTLLLACGGGGGGGGGSAVSWDSLDWEAVVALDSSMSSAAIPLGPESSGTVIAFRSCSGYYGKLRITGVGSDSTLHFEEVLWASYGSLFFDDENCSAHEGDTVSLLDPHVGTIGGDDFWWGLQDGALSIVPGCAPDAGFVVVR